MDVNSLLDTAREVCKASSDKELAPHLGIKPSAVSNYRKGVSYPNPVVCATLAGITGVPLTKVLGIVGEARAISREEKAVWRKLAATAATLLLGVGLALPQHAQAEIEGVSGQQTIHYAKSWIARQMQWLAWWLASLLPSRPPSNSEVEA